VIDTPPVANERLRPGRTLRHVLVGARAGFVAGGLTTAGPLLWEGDAFRWAGTLAAMALLGTPAGMILGGGLALVDYRSRSGVESALVGAGAAALFVASMGPLRPRPLVLALALFVLTGWLASRATGRRETRPREAHPTRTTLAVHATTALVLAAVYWWIFEVVLLAID
jgi:hypothetical protein